MEVQVYSDPSRRLYRVLSESVAGFSGIYNDGDNLGNSVCDDTESRVSLNRLSVLITPVFDAIPGVGPLVVLGAHSFASGCAAEC